MNFESTFSIGDVLAAAAFVIAAITVVREIRRAAVDKASRLAVWTAIPHDRVKSAGIRGVVITNTSGEVARNGAVTTKMGDLTLRDVYPVVPPGTQFLTLQVQDKDSAGQPTQQWTPDQQQQFQPYWMLAGTETDGRLEVELRKNDEPKKFELTPWVETAGTGSFTVEELSFELGNRRWVRHRDKPVKRLRTRHHLPGAEETRRIFPHDALTAEQKQAEAESTQGSYEQSRDLIAALAAEFTSSGLQPGSEAKAQGELQKLGIAKVRRTKAIQRSGKDRGGIALDFYLAATDAKPAYSIGASEWGALPQWFGWVKPKDSTAPSRSFLTRPAFKRRRTADAWTSNVLAAEVIAAIRDDLAAHRRA
ncbi:hypothetical protein [uncultured Microbacterium sp.]|uniref:hypothetical protein n=1 Tax=uncultured Microbacterium sp. TaxID=191216 RepID=UPI00262487F5|nr:hypothetical protein [uncultured Microbacterium sp.]